MKLYYIYKGGLYYHSVYPKDESFLALVCIIPEMSSLEVDVDKHIPLGDFIDVYGYYSYEGINLIHYCEDEALL